MTNVKDIEKINRGVADINKALIKVGKTVGECVDGLNKLIKIIEDENRRKEENMWYKHNPSNPYMPDSRELMTAHCDFAAPDSKDCQTELYEDPLTMCTIQKLYCDGKVTQVLQIEKDGTTKDVTEEYKDKED